jgi:cytochrome c556
MRRSMATTPTAVFAAVLAILIASLAAPLAQQPAAGGSPQSATPGAPPKPLIPVATNTVTANPDAYYGVAVTLTAAVEQILSTSAFSVAQRTVGAAGSGAANPRQDVLILAPTLHGAVDLNTYVTVFGEVVRFDPDEVARKVKNYKLDLAPDVVAKYRGRPAVLATAVINASFVDLAKRLPPPMTAEEQAFSKVMKRVGPAFAALRTGIDGSSAESTTQNATVLKQAFVEAGAFWKTKGKTDATQWAEDARKQAESIERGAAGGEWDAVKASAGTLGQACQTCHAAYRERFDDGTFRIKTGG